jgi:hypothetical protein
VTVGNVAFVEADERDERIAALRAAGVADVVASWAELETLLTHVDTALEAGRPT